MPQELVVTRETSAPPDAVWAVITNIAGSADTLRGVDAVEVLEDPGGFAPGLRWRETRTMMGRTESQEMAVTAVDAANRSYVVEADAHGAHYRSTMSAAPAGDGATITMSFGAEPTGTVARILGATLGKLAVGATRRALQQDLDDIAAAAEARAAG